MTNCEHTDLMAIGDHCSHPGCGQRDFLPFRCDCCGKVFCLEHRAYSRHNCEHAQGKDTHIIVCPLCAKSIKLKGNEDVQQVFDAHARTNCDPSNYSRVHSKRRCGVAMLLMATILCSAFTGFRAAFCLLRGT
jgi:hypothetical protein